MLSQESFDDNYQRYTCRSDKNKKLSFNEYMDVVKRYIITLLNDTNKQQTRKIQLDIRITTENILNPGDKRNFIVRSDNTVPLYTDDTTESVENLIKSLGEHYEEQILVSKKGSNFRCCNIDSLNIYIHEVQLNRGGSYIETPNWVKAKKTTINPKNTTDDYCFAHSVVIALYHKQIGKNPQRRENLKPYYKHFNWEGINTPTTIKDWKRFEDNNPDVSLNIFSVPFNDEEIRTEYVSFFNRERNNQVTSLMITDGTGKWHYTALKSIETSNGTLKSIKSYSRLMKDYSSKDKGDFYCYNCGNSYRADQCFSKT